MPKMEIRRCRVKADFYAQRSAPLQFLAQFILIYTFTGPTFDEGKLLFYVNHCLLSALSAQKRERNTLPSHFWLLKKPNGHALPPLRSIRTKDYTEKNKLSNSNTCRSDQEFFSLQGKNGSLIFPGMPVMLQANTCRISLSSKNCSYTASQVCCIVLI